MARVKIEILHVPTQSVVAVGYEHINNLDEYDALKSIFIEAVEGKVTFLKVVTETQSDILLGRNILSDSKIELTICQ